jgi:hypothetical protein
MLSERQKALNKLKQIERKASVAREVLEALRDLVATAKELHAWREVNDELGLNPDASVDDYLA